MDEKFFDFYPGLSYIAWMLNKIFSLFWSTKVALVLLILIFLSCTVSVFLPPALSKGAVFSSLWFNLLLLLLIVNIVFCIVKRIRILRLAQIGTTIFHLGLVLLFIGVVYAQLFFFEGAIRLTEGETLSCADMASYDRTKKGRFFQTRKLEELGGLYFHKLHAPYAAEGKARGAANEIAVGRNVQEGEKRIIYVTRPLKYKGFEFYRDNRDGYSPLFVLRDGQGRVLSGAYAPLQSIMQKDGTYLYRSGTANAPGSFNFPQDSGLPAVFRLQTVYYPDKIKKMAGEVSFQVWKANNEAKPGAPESSEELFKGKAAFGERVKVADYLISMDEVRYWTSINLIYRPGLKLIFGSLWVAFGGLILTLILKSGIGSKKKVRCNEQ
jgi:hypothetical protein